MRAQMLRLGIAQHKQIQFQLTLIQDVPLEEHHFRSLMIGMAMEFQIGMTSMMTTTV